MANNEAYRNSPTTWFQMFDTEDRAQFHEAFELKIGDNGYFRRVVDPPYTWQDGTPVKVIAESYGNPPRRSPLPDIRFFSSRPQADQAYTGQRVSITENGIRCDLEQVGNNHDQFDPLKPGQVSTSYLFNPDDGTFYVLSSRTGERRTFQARITHGLSSVALNETDEGTTPSALSVVRPMLVQVNDHVA